MNEHADREPGRPGVEQERVVELAARRVAGAPAEGLEELCAEPELRALATDTDAVLSTARRSVRDAEARELPPLRESRLIGRILAATTREDLSWRGDWTLLRRFLTERLTSSPALRWVAASLVVHLLALPFFGIGLLEERTVPVLRFEPAPDVPIDLAEATEPTDPAPRTDSNGETPLAAIENALRRGRYVLSRATPLAPLSAEALADAPLEIRLLLERSRGLGDHGVEGEVSLWVEEGAGLESADDGQTALWAEVLLDGYCLRGEQPPALSRALNRLARSEASGKGEALGAAALGRARSYGLWESVEGADGPPAPRAPLPLEGPWLDALEELLKRRSDVPAAWIAPWRR